MVVVWLVVQVLFLCLFFTLPAHVETITADPGETTPLNAEKLPTTQHAINVTTINITTTTTTATVHRMSWAIRLWYLVKEETVVVLAVLFVVFFQQTALEVWPSTFCGICNTSSHLFNRPCVFLWPKIYWIGTKNNLVDFIVWLELW